MLCKLYDHFCLIHHFTQYNKNFQCSVLTVKTTNMQDMLETGLSRLPEEGELIPLQVCEITLKKT